MIQLFVLDIDGCITHPFQTPHWESISEIRELNRQSRNRKEIPPLTLCTGRPMPYAEAVAQWLDIRLPFVFESAGLYHWEGNRIQTILDKGAKSENGRLLKPIEEIKKWLTEQVLPEYPDIILEFSKIMDAGVVSPDREQIDRIYEQIMEHTRSHYPDLEVHRTEISVNTLLAGNNKGTGFRLLSDELGIPFENMAYIGDSEGDLPALEKVKMPFAPSNAIDRVKNVAEVMPFETSQAVLEAYKRIIETNK
jgi:HAD superfamily hydrolase (TIGR01484 family)